MLRTSESWLEMLNLKRDRVHCAFCTFICVISILLFMFLFFYVPVCIASACFGVVFTFNLINMIFNFSVLVCTVVCVNVKKFTFNDNPISSLLLLHTVNVALSKHFVEKVN